MSSFSNGFRRALLSVSALAGALTLGVGGEAAAETPVFQFDIPAKDLGAALRAYSAIADQQVIFSDKVASTKTAPEIKGRYTAQGALDHLLANTGFVAQRTAAGVIVISQAAPETAKRRVAVPRLAAPETVSGSAVEGLVVTAQKRREAIQDVPIAISAFSADALQAQKIEGGFDLLKAIPNVTFSKNNFSGYNFSIRGIGTKAISVTTDQGVAVEFNNVPLIRNRLFEQEYFDVERVEVLRGPQGTLHGRNATSGVINLISNKAELDEFDGQLKGEVGNFHTKRLSGMINVPLIEDVLAVRFAGALTQREGYDFNLYNNEHTNGRDLWSGRLTIGFEPTDRIRADFIWERFNEDDDRARTGKQLCTHDPGPATVDGYDTTYVPPDSEYSERRYAIVRGGLSQGCLPGSLYDDKAFGTPNGLAIPFVYAMADSGIGFCFQCGGSDLNNAIRLLTNIDPYGNQTQSRDLRELYSQILPKYRAEADIFELNLDFDVSDSLMLSSQTAYNRDRVYSTQDFNRYTTLPAFGDSNLAYDNFAGTTPTDFNTAKFTPNGVFCDPQLGCSNTIVGQDLSRARSRQFSQEFRLQSDFEGALNFSAGLSYTRYQTVEDYYVFFNGITMAAIKSANTLPPAYGSSSPDRFTTHPDCDALGGPFGPDIPDSLVCVPIENNPISNIQDTGHNYFLSRNPYKLDSRAVFGELYWQAAETVRLTAGLRYTDDRKVFTPIPSETLLTPASRADAFEPVLGSAGVQFAKGNTFLISFGSGAYPALPDVRMEWKEYTGRLGLDWTPDISFTDQTMVYAFYSRGYKGGGMNPPPVGLDFEAIRAAGRHLSPSAPPTFRPEFVNAFELGVKNTLLSGALVMNGGVFFYDYKDYQVSKIVDRSAQNENFDAKIWGLEFESVFQPTRNLRFNVALGYLDTEIAKNSKSIDIMNRTAGHEGWLVVKPFITMTSNCIAPASVVRYVLEFNGSNVSELSSLCPPLTPYAPNGDGPEIFWDPAQHPEINFGAGFDSDVSGHELPNSPHFTASLGGQYSVNLLEDWQATVRGDFYWQSQQWARIYALPIDKLHAWSNANLSLWLEKSDEDLKIEFYIKNLFDETPITDTFTNSDDTALTTNIFTLDPRLIGLQITKGF